MTMAYKVYKTIFSIFWKLLRLDLNSTLSVTSCGRVTKMARVDCVRPEGGNKQTEMVWFGEAERMDSLSI